MSKHCTQFEAAPGGMILTNAILLYQNETVGQMRTAFASIHPVEHRDGQPTIEAGTPLTRAHLRQWTETLGKSVAPEILPDNILVAHADMLAWWVPAMVRPSYFALSRPPAGLKKLAERTTLPLPYPAHLFIATRAGLGVYALPASERPTAETPILHSPVLNVFINGQLCWGDVPKPKTLSIASIADFERAVFDSWSTHPNHGQELTVSWKGGLIGMWDDLAAHKAKRFPTNRLKHFYPGTKRPPAPMEPITLGKLIARSVKA